MMNLAALLFDVARRLPERPAVSDERQSRNFRELARRIAGVAGGLRARGLQRGDRVLLCLENCGEFVELLFGCWAARLCAVPANARLHPREVEYIAENSGARLLVATPGLIEALAPLVGTVETLDAVISTETTEYDALVSKSEPVMPQAGEATDRAWLFYTSGTTGRPKGAVLTHRNLLFMSQCYYADIDRSMSATRISWRRRCRMAPGFMRCRFCCRARTRLYCRISIWRRSSMSSHGMTACRSSRRRRC